MTEVIHQQVEETTVAETVQDLHVTHAYCEQCYPEDKPMPVWVVAVCGATVLESEWQEPPEGTDVYTLPPDPCVKCLVTHDCVNGHAGGARS